jgi:hypothetical protein
MKLRIRGDSIRLRLKRGEVAQVASGQGIEENTHFPGSVLTYRLDVSGDDAIAAGYENGNLVVSLPAARVAAWANSDEVSLMATQDLAGGLKLTVLVEKDFSCLDPGHGRDHEDDADTFPHPSAASGGTC